MADIDLPVWSFRANWSEGVDERLEWKTDVLRADEGAEQRRSVRPTPRRVIEADFLVSGAERTFYDLFMHRLGAGECMIPLYWDASPISSAAVAGVTDRLVFDTRWTEFAPGLAILQAKSALVYEVVEITSADDSGLDLASATGRSWPAGTTVTPLRRGLIDDMGSLTHHSARVASVSAQLLLTCPNPREAVADAGITYLGLPVFTDEPNWVEPLAAELARDAVRFDPETGVPYQTDPTGRANVGQAHRWFLAGRERLASFRDMLYRRRGRAAAFWLPTFKSDLTLVNSPSASATQITIENVGYDYIGGPTSGREHIVIFLRSGGPIIRRVTSVLAGLTAATERLNLDSALGLDLSPGQVRKICFLDAARFDQDSFDLSHPVNSTGLTECTGVFRTFKNSRDPAGANSLPIPTAAPGLTACGPDVPSDCYAVPVFEGWYYKLIAFVTGANPEAGWSGYTTGTNGPAITSFSIDTAVTIDGVTLPANHVFSGIIVPGDLTYGGKKFFEYRVIDKKTFEILFYFSPFGMTLTSLELQWGNTAFPGVVGCDSYYSVASTVWDTNSLALPIASDLCALNTFTSEWGPFPL